MFSTWVPLSGVTYSRDLEWRLAAHWAGYKRFDEFFALPGDEQSEIVATYRVDARMHAVADYQAVLEAQAKRR